jgi:hypothetical protein
MRAALRIYATARFLWNAILLSAVLIRSNRDGIGEDTGYGVSFLRDGGGNIACLENSRASHSSRR